MLNLDLCKQNFSGLLIIEVAEMKNPYESLPMGTDSCDGIKDICEKLLN